MRLTQLTITNFGIYKNDNVFKFPYSSEKKVSIIQGKNGAGKTTFLNAIKVCLFGSMILKNSTITKNYETFILDRLNKDAIKESSPNFSIKATFISQVHNFDGEFTIERIWDINTNFKEIVHMLKNGKKLNQDEQESFFNALYHSFPLDLFELFYLDGEKIDHLSILNSSILSLLESSINIDLFKKLKSDLLTYASKRVNTKEVITLSEKKEAIENNQRQLLEYIKNSYQQSETLIKQIDIKADEIKNLKDSLNIGTRLNDSSSLKSLEQEINTKKHEIEIEIIKFLPFTLVSEQLKNLLTKIESEQEINKNSTITNALQSKELLTYLAENKVEKDFQTLINTICDFYPTNSEQSIHNLSHDDSYSLKSKIDKLLQFNTSELNEKIKSLNLLEGQFSKLYKQVSGVEALKASGQLDNLLLLQSKYDEFKNSLTNVQSDILNSETKFENNSKELKIIEDALWTQLKKSNIANVLEQIHEVLDEYITRIKHKKITEIEQHTKNMFDLLIRKNGFISTFNIENDEIYLLDKNNNRLNHSNLSAGEKQIFVLSLLYAILQSSERRVPLMFDTLLGRLDKEHRDNVFKKFISSCPDQVIILATDSELVNIDKEYLSSITNIIYTIDFSKSENQMLEMRT